MPLEVGLESNGTGSGPWHWVGAAWPCSVRPAWLGASRRACADRRTFGVVGRRRRGGREGASAAGLPRVVPLVAEVTPERVVDLVADEPHVPQQVVVEAVEAAAVL